MAVRKQKKQDRRIQVNLIESEFALVCKAAKEQGETVPSYCRRILMANLKNEGEQGSASPIGGIQQSVEWIAARISKLERLQRYVMMNTAIARGHATGVLEAIDSVTSDKIQTRIIEARDQQRQIFFELYPEQKEGDV